MSNFNKFVRQRLVNDCILATLANFIHIKTDIPAEQLYLEITQLIKDPSILSAHDYDVYAQGDGMPLDVIESVCQRYHIPVQLKLTRPHPDDPYIIIMPVDLDEDFRYDVHCILWTGQRLLDPIQFKKLQTQESDLPKVLEISSFYW